MSSLRKRNAKASTETSDNSNKAISTLKRVQFAVEDIIFSKRRPRRDKIRRIEEMSVWPYIIFFIAFLTCAIYLVDYIHRLDDDGEYDPVTRRDTYTRRFIEVRCSDDYGSGFKDCRPKKCGRGIRDNLFTLNELNLMRSLVEKGMKHGGGSGGATILDLHTGALSYGDQFINFYKAKPGVFNASDFELYKSIKNRIHTAIAEEFKINKNHLYLTNPTFFSRLTNKAAVTKHDEYWHPHIDRVTYKTFFYTSLLYLSEYEKDFTGGRFMFVDSKENISIEPKFGRLSFFTSGSENEHFVEKVESGIRYAITVSFTCNKKHKIGDPSLS